MTGPLIFCLPFLSTPVLKVKSKDGRYERSYSYVDAVVKYQKSLSRQDLHTAYLRAGSSFNGTLRQNFVVLRDPEPKSSVSRSSKRTTRGSDSEMDTVMERKKPRDT